MERDSCEIERKIQIQPSAFRHITYVLHTYALIVYLSELFLFAERQVIHSTISVKLKYK